MKHVETPNMRQRLCAIIAAGTLAASTMGAPLMAFADPVNASAGSQTGSGATDVTVQMQTDAGEVGGNTDPDNPDGTDEGDYGDNIAFSVPASINFVAKPDGTLIGPDASATYIENHSAFEIRASSMKVTAEDDWNLVEDVSSVSDGNSVDFTFGPEGDELVAARYTTKGEVNEKGRWEMSYARTGASETADRVQLKTAGHIARVDNDIKTRSKVATINTYVTQGKAPSSGAQSDPVQP